LVTDANGCTASGLVAVNNIGAPTVSISSSIDVSCNSGNDGEATVSASGGILPYTYQWNDTDTQTTATATGLTAGIYAATVTDSAGCIAVAIDTIDEPSAINISYTVDTASQGNNDGSATVSVTGGTPPYTYLWDDPGAQTDSAATGLFAGSYTIIITDSIGCIDSLNIVVSEITGIENLNGFKNLADLTIYPNPTKGIVTFDIVLVEASNVQIQVYNILGEVLYTQKLQNIKSAKKKIDLKSLPNGIYLIKFVTPGFAIHKRIVIAK